MSVRRHMQDTQPISGKTDWLVGQIVKHCGRARIGLIGDVSTRDGLKIEIRQHQFFDRDKGKIKPPELTGPGPRSHQKARVSGRSWRHC